MLSAKGASRSRMDRRLFCGVPSCGCCCFDDEPVDADRRVDGVDMYACMLFYRV